MRSGVREDPSFPYLRIWSICRREVGLRRGTERHRVKWEIEKRSESCLFTIANIRYSEGDTLPWEEKLDTIPEVDTESLREFIVDRYLIFRKYGFPAQYPIRKRGRRDIELSGELSSWLGIREMLGKSTSIHTRDASSQYRVHIPTSWEVFLDLFSVIFEDIYGIDIRCSRRVYRELRAEGEGKEEKYDETRRDRDKRERHWKRRREWPHMGAEGIEEEKSGTAKRCDEPKYESIKKREECKECSDAHERTESQSEWEEWTSEYEKYGEVDCEKRDKRGHEIARSECQREVDLRSPCREERCEDEECKKWKREWYRAHEESELLCSRKLRDEVQSDIGEPYREQCCKREDDAIDDEKESCLSSACESEDLDDRECMAEGREESIVCRSHDDCREYERHQYDEEDIVGELLDGIERALGPLCEGADTIVLVRLTNIVFHGICCSLASEGD